MRTMDDKRTPKYEGPYVIQNPVGVVCSRIASPENKTKYQKFSQTRCKITCEKTKSEHSRRTTRTYPSKSNVRTDFQQHTNRTR